MSSPTEPVTTTEIEEFDDNKSREEVLISWGVKQEEPDLFEKSDIPSSPTKEILNDVTITDSIPHDSIPVDGKLKHAIK